MLSHYNINSLSLIIWRTSPSYLLHKFLHYFLVLSISFLLTIFNFFLYSSCLLSKFLLPVLPTLLFLLYFVQLPLFNFLALFFSLPSSLSFYNSLYLSLPHFIIPSLFLNIYLSIFLFSFPSICFPLSPSSVLCFQIC